MSNPTVVFDPYATAELRNIVQTIVDNHNVAITGRADWYPVAFFLRDETWRSVRRFARRYLGSLAARPNACRGRACAPKALSEHRFRPCGRLFHEKSG